jgi:hypothetical protein
MRVKDEEITKKLKGKEKREVIKGTENKEEHKKNHIGNWVECATMQRALKAWLFEDNGGFKTLPQVNGFEGFKGKNTPHRSKPSAHSTVCFTKMNKKVYKTSE